MYMINRETGERAPGHRIGTDEDGDELFCVPDGWCPAEPYWLDQEGYAHAGDAVTAQEEPDACRFAP